MGECTVALYNQYKASEGRRITMRSVSIASHDHLRALLLHTGDIHLAQIKPNDGFWGLGRDGSGKNMLGILLMEIRDELSSELPTEGAAK
jgi:predicted NAD-dependent protein-ADP-ribosyltransferase YbiA (DUF1768 family)